MVPALRSLEPSWQVLIGTLVLGLHALAAWVFIAGTARTSVDVSPRAVVAVIVDEPEAPRRIVSAGSRHPDPVGLAPAARAVGQVSSAAPAPVTGPGAPDAIAAAPIAPPPPVARPEAPAALAEAVRAQRSVEVPAAVPTGLPAVPQAVATPPAPATASPTPQRPPPESRVASMAGVSGVPSELPVAPTLPATAMPPAKPPPKPPEPSAPPAASPAIQRPSLPAQAVSGRSVAVAAPTMPAPPVPAPPAPTVSRPAFEGPALLPAAPSARSSPSSALPAAEHTNAASTAPNPASAPTQRRSPQPLGAATAGATDAARGVEVRSARPIGGTPPSSDGDGGHPRATAPAVVAAGTAPSGVPTPRSAVSAAGTSAATPAAPAQAQGTGAGIRRGLVPIEKHEPVFPAAALRAGITRGRVVARVDVDASGRVDSVTIVTAEPQRYFNRSVVEALMRWRFRPDGMTYVGEIEIGFVTRD